MECVFCKKEIEIEEGRVGRRDTCPSCGRDLHCCRQCKFYDQSAYNECREVSAERVVNKDRANFCDHYVHRGSKERSGKLNKTREAKEALEALFRK